MAKLDDLENEAIYIIREAYASIPKLGMLWSMGKDSTVILWLVRKAFLGHVPFPVVHVDTKRKIPEMIRYRDQVAAEMGLNLIVGVNEEAIADGMGPERGRLECCGALKTEGLRQVIQEHQFGGLLVGIRRDEEGSRAKERVFSPRDSSFEWNFRDQPPELWDQFRTDYGDDVHIRVHPIINWNERDVWDYIRRENIPITDLYFAQDGQRYRSLGCECCTGMIESAAATVDEIIEELATITASERGNRAQDQEDAYAMQKLRVKGYM